MACNNLMNEICLMLDTYKGRDKILRTLCYSARLIGGLTKNQELAKKFLFISSHLSGTRTTLRLLDDIPMLKYTLEYGLGKEEDNSLMASVGVLTNIIDQIYYPVEKVSWLAEHKLISGINNDKWDTISSVFWIASIYLTLIKTLRYVLHLKKHINEIKNQNAQMANVSLEKMLTRETFELISCLRLSLDLIHAINTLPKGFLWSSKLNVWQIGMIGTLSSLLGCYQYFSKRNL